MADWKDILNNDERPLSEEDLLNYLNKNTSEIDKKQIEEIATEDFEADALEGLKLLPNADVTQNHVAALKHQLQKQLRNKKLKRARKPNNEMQWILYTAILLLLTCVLAYVVIRMFRV